MALAPPRILIEPFAATGDRNSVPFVPGATPGLASYDLGFPPATMLPLTSGGVPPSGKDFNGILFDITSAIAWMNSGRAYSFSSVLAAAIGGYQIGARVVSTVDPLVTWVCLLGNNSNDPDVDPTGWTADRAHGGTYLASTVPAGTNNNFSPTGFGKWVESWDLDPNGGNSILTGIAAGAPGQTILVSNTNATNLLTLAKIAAGSAAANQIRGPADLDLAPGAAMFIRYLATPAKWVMVP